VFQAATGFSNVIPLKPVFLAGRSEVSGFRVFRVVTLQSIALVRNLCSPHLYFIVYEFDLAINKNFLQQS
jgi:hypothetical protein